QWIDSGQMVTFAFTSPVATSPASGKRYSLTSITGGVISGVTSITAPATVTGTYVTQYRVTVAQSGIGTDTGGDTVLTEPSPAGSPWSKSQLDGGAVFEWITDGQSISFAYTTDVDTAPASGKRYHLSSTSDTSPYTVSGAAHTVTGTYVTQYKV